MDFGTIRLDHQGLRTFLRGAEVEKAIDELAEAVAESLGHMVPVGAAISIRPYKWDRAAASVTVSGVGIMSAEGKYGMFAKAAAANGLEIRHPKHPKG